MDPLTLAAPGTAVTPAGEAPAGPPLGPYLGERPTGRRSGAPVRRSGGGRGGRRGLLRRMLPRTVPARIRLWSAAAGLTAVALFVITDAAIGDTREGLEVIGREAGPQVVATSDLYFALSDMDAQVAEVLLIGREQKLGIGRKQALRIYERRRTEANRALRQAAVLARDGTARKTVDALLDRLGKYEELAGQAILLDRQAKHLAGPPPERVMRVYRAATDVMRLELLPQASNLTLDNAAVVRSTYEEKRSAVLVGRLLAALVGIVLFVLLVGLQIYLAGHYRRLFNPALALATVVSVLLVTFTFILLSREAGHLKVAKEDGFDSTLGLSRARAMSHDADADQIRFLLDTRWSDRYEQVFLDKSKQLLGVEATNMSGYAGAMETALDRYGKDGTVGFVGLYGTELQAITSPGERATADAVLSRYRKYQRDDRRMRELVARGKRHDAIVFRVSRTPGNAAYDFMQYDRGIVSLTEINRKTFEGQILAGKQALTGWGPQLPAAAVMITALILLGVRPRLAEYR